jgi:hypothetical protein
MATKQITMTVGEETHEWIEQEALDRQRSMSYVAREYLHEAIPEDLETEVTYR